MGRNRKHNKHLPRGVTLERGSYFFRGSDRKRINLGRGFADAMAKYGELFRDAPLSTFAHVLDRYLQLVVPKKAASTQEGNRRQIATLRRIFGDMRPAAILPTHVYRMRDQVAAKSGAVQSNQHLALMKHVFTKAIEWGATTTNPAREVRKNRVKPRTRYVTDEELAKVYALAPPMMQGAIDLAVLTGLRRGDLLNLTRAQLQEDGIHVVTGKTGRALIIEWSDELRAVVDRLKLLKPQFRQNIIATNQGKPFTPSGFSTAWERSWCARRRQA